MSGHKRGRRSRADNDCPVVKGRGSSETSSNDARCEIIETIGLDTGSKGRRRPPVPPKKRKENHGHRDCDDNSCHEGFKEVIDVKSEEEPMVIDCSQSSSGHLSRVSKYSESSDVMVVEALSSAIGTTDPEQSTSKRKVKKPRKRSPSPVFTLRRDMNEPLKNFSDCDTLYHGYVPSIIDGDVVEWTTVRSRNNSGNSIKKGNGNNNGTKNNNNNNNNNCSKKGDKVDNVINLSPIKNPGATINGTSYNLLSARCKGCQEQFVINNDNALLKIYLNHCMKECPKYQSLDLIKFCDPCNLYCMDMNTFVSHGKSNQLDCPMYDSFNFWSKRYNANKKNNSNKNSNDKLDKNSNKNDKLDKNA